jgi:hypothetical protein
MHRHATLSIALFPILAAIALPKGAYGGPYPEHTERVWSSREGVLRPHFSGSPAPEGELGNERPDQPSDWEPLRSPGILICEPFH